MSDKTVEFFFDFGSPTTYLAHTQLPRLARELGPQNIHVAHVVVDGAIDTDFIRTSFPERYALKDQDGILNPEHIAEAYWQLHRQPRSAWTHEMDLRPWSETF